MPETIISQFSIPGILLRSGRFGSGLINDTFLCEFHDNGETSRYILQRINSSVFMHPEQVMHNIEVVTKHIVGRLRYAGIVDPCKMTPVLIKSRCGRSFIVDESGQYWRVFRFIDDGTVYDTVRDKKHAYEIGRSVGRFQSLVSDLSPDSLYDTLPGFHSTPNYLSEYDNELKADAHQRSAEVLVEQEFVHHRRYLAPVLIDLIASHDVPLRVVHNDPKVNNIMLRKETGETLCMLDLDTVKPGIVHFDFGDCVRSAANPAGENAKDLGSIAIDMELFKAIAEGYLKEAGAFLTKKEISMLPVSAQVITFELGIRFLADYIRGDSYFKIEYPTQNLHRARIQFRLLESIEKAQGRMVTCIRQLSQYR
jgi:Ser/Thr protein kinase RdoA (MazF antagonist)